MAVDQLAGRRLVEQPAERVAADDAELERRCRRAAPPRGPGDVAGEAGQEGGLHRLLGRLRARRRRRPAASAAEREEKAARLQNRSLVPT